MLLQIPQIFPFIVMACHSCHISCHFSPGFRQGGPGLRAAFPTHEIIGEESAAARAQQQLPPATLTVGDGGGSNGW